MTLQQIIEAVKSGEQPDYDELRYALLALDQLATFTENEMSGTHYQLVKREYLAAMLELERANLRSHRIRTTCPKETVGWAQDPSNPDYQERRQLSKAIIEKRLH